MTENRHPAIKRVEFTPSTMEETLHARLTTERTRTAARIEAALVRYHAAESAPNQPSDFLVEAKAELAALNALERVAGMPTTRMETYHSLARAEIARQEYARQEPKMVDADHPLHSLNRDE